MSQSGDKKKIYSYKVYAIGGGSDPIAIDASRFEINQDKGVIEFFGDDDTPHSEWTVFLHGVAAIHQTGKGAWGVRGRILG